MADHENENQNEEEMEEEILINQEEGEGEGQDFYAIEMQINDEPYLIVIGKTEENKIFLRLMNKEDQNKPFFHNEFSLEDLKNINPIFNGIESEDIAFQYLVSNLNDAEKDVKIIDEEKINFSIIITDEEEKLEFDFILIKSIDDGNGENEMEEEGIEEMINEVVDDINEETGENNEVSEQREKEKNIPIRIDIILFLKSNPKIDAAKAPVHPPVPGNGIPTNNVKATYTLLPVFFVISLPAFSPFFNINLKILLIHFNHLGSFTSLPHINNFLANKYINGIGTILPNIHIIYKR